MLRFVTGKVALVTGGASGIGRASAIAFARAGAKVVVADCAETEGRETVEVIRAAGSEAAFVRADVSQAGDARALIEKTVATYGRLDCAHNNAGIEGQRARTATCTEENWDRTLAVNLKGVWLCMKYEIPQMLRQGGGAIVNTSSIAGLVGLWKFPAYAASKHGVIGLTKTAALEYARTGIRVNAVCPGVIDTQMVERIINRDRGAKSSNSINPLRRVWRSAERLAMRHHLKSLAPIGRIGTADEVAQTVVWLCSDAASLVTGHALSVDGGIVAE